MIKIDHLRHFIAASETGSFSAAAIKANISPTSIRNSIQKLELRLNTSLFVRKPSNGVSLTDDGRRLFEQSKALLVNVEEIESSFISKDRKLHGNLTIGCQEGLTWSLIPRAINKMNEEYPDLNISVKTVLMDSKFEPLEKADVDVLITFTLQTNIQKKFSITDLCAPQTCVMMRKNHPLDTGQAVKLKDLAQHPHIFMKDGPAWDFFYTMYEERNLEPNIYMYSNTISGVQAIVGSSDVVLLCILRPSNPLTPLGDPMVVTPLKDKVRRPRLVAVTSKIRSPNAFDKRLVFIDICQSLFDNGDMKAHVYY